MATDFMNKTSARILPDLSKPTYEQLLARVQELETRPARKVWFKVTEKGGISAYGLGQFPVTLYKSQWEQLMPSGLVSGRSVPLLSESLFSKTLPAFSALPRQP